MTIRNLTDEEARELVRACNKRYKAYTDQCKRVGTDVMLKPAETNFRKGFDEGAKAALEMFEKIVGARAIKRAKHEH